MNAAQPAAKRPGTAASTEDVPVADDHLRSRKPLQFGLSTLVVAILAVGVAIGFCKWVLTYPSLCVIVAAVLIGAVTGGTMSRYTR